MSILKSKSTVIAQGYSDKGVMILTMSTAAKKLRGSVVKSKTGLMLYGEESKTTELDRPLLDRIQQMAHKHFQDTTPLETVYQTA